MSADLEPRRLAAVADEIRIEVAAAEADFQSAVQHAIAAGEKLIEAKALVRHGEWLPWLEANFTMTRRAATTYMRLARNGNRVSHLPTVRQAIALLTEPTNDGARDDGAHDRLAMARVWLAIAESEDPAGAARAVAAALEATS